MVWDSQEVCVASSALQKTPCVIFGGGGLFSQRLFPAQHPRGDPRQRSGHPAAAPPPHLVQELQLLAAVHQLVGVDEAPGNRAWVQDEVLGHPHQHVPVLARVGEAAHGHAGGVTRHRRSAPLRHKPTRSTARACPGQPSPPTSSFHFQRSVFLPAVVPGADSFTPP